MIYQQNPDDIIIQNLNSLMYLFGVSKKGERFQSLGYEIKQGGDQ